MHVVPDPASPAMPPTPETHCALIAQIDQLATQIRAARAAVAEIIYGQERVVEETMTALLAGGHVLLIGVPGLGKTRLVETLGGVFGLEARRVQFTPDLMPADILGSEILDEGDGGQRHFRFVPGPVFCQLLMADEINRASPRTQSALLQAMQEHRVSVAGHYHPLPTPFHVLATQNPIEQEGTFPLPEAQLDRFFMQIDVDYPDRAAEREILIATTGAREFSVRPVMTGEGLCAAQRLLRHVPVGESVVEAILELVRSGRPETSPLAEVRSYVAWGPGPRASQAMMQAIRVRAVLQGRYAPSVDDVLALAHPVLRHRMALSFAARAERITLRSIIERLCEQIG